MYFIKDHAKAVIIAAIVLAIGAGVAVWFLVFNGDGAKEAKRQAELAEPIAFTLSPTAEKWDASSSTPLIVHFSGTNKDGEGVDYYHAMTIGEDESFELASGVYEMSFITPVNADGSVYSVPKATTVDKESASTFNVEMKLKDAETLSKTEAESIIKNIGEAITFGDDTISGTKGKNILNKAKANIRKAPNVGGTTTDMDTSNNRTSTTQSDRSSASAASASAQSASAQSANANASSSTSARASSNATANTGSQTGSQTTSNASANTSSRSTSSANSNNSQSSAKKWVETTVKKEKAKSLKLVKRADGTVYFEEADGDEEQLIDVAGHWE